MSEENRNINNEENTAPEAESAAARRLRMLGITAEEEAKKDEIPPQKKGLIPFLENFWYHYKLAAIMVTFALIVVGVGVYQYINKNISRAGYCLTLTGSNPLNLLHRLTVMSKKSS